MDTYDGSQKIGAIVAPSDRRGPGSQRGSCSACGCYVWMSVVSQEILRDQPDCKVLCERCVPADMLDNSLLPSMNDMRRAFGNDPAISQLLKDLEDLQSGRLDALEYVKSHVKPDIADFFRKPPKK